MARRLGEAFVSIEADASLFRASAFAGVKKALAGISGKIPVTADTAAARKQIDALKIRMINLSRQLAEIKIGANGKPAEATIRKLQLQLKNLADNVASITMNADTSRVDAKIAKERLNLAKLKEQASSLVLDADAKRLILKIAMAEEQLFRLKSDIEADSELGLDTSLAVKKFQSVKADLAVLNATARKMVIDANATSLIKAIRVSRVEIEKLKAEAARIKIGGEADLGKLASTDLALLGLEDAAKKLNPELDATNTKLITGARGFGRFGLGALAARVALFGGLSAVSGWHIALDTLIESLAVIIPALVTAAAGLAAFGIAGVDAARQVYNRLQNIHTVADALNATIPPMTGHLEALHAVVRPQVWQLYGDAIAIAHSKTGLFEQLAIKTGSVVDTLAARLTILATSSGTGLKNFLDSGARDLKEFGRIFVSLGDAFGKLIRVTQETGIAEALLKILGAAAKLFDLFTKIPMPILATVIALHGIYLWSGLAASGIIALLRPLGRMASSAAGAKLAGTAVKDLAAAGNDSRFARLGATFRDLGTNLRSIPGRALAAAKAVGTFLISPWGLVAVGVLALGALIYGLAKTKSATDRFIDSLNEMTTHATVFNIINTLGTELALNTNKLAATQVSLKGKLKDVAAQSKIYGGTLAYQNANISQSNEAVRDLTANHAKLAGELVKVGGRLSQVSSEFGVNGLSGAMALAHVAGVSVDDLLSDKKGVWATAIQKIAGVVQGYANMGVGATQLGNAINVLTIAQSDQLKNVETLNTAFDQFTKIVSGPISGFLTFANTLKRFGTDAGAAGAQMTGLGSGFTKVSKKMTDASLQLQTDFQDTFNAAAQMADAMRLTGTASEKQISAIKDVVQVMIPMAGSNKAAAAEISALAQEAGGPATTNLKSLAKWAGHTKDPLGQAQKAAADAAISFFNMSEDAKKLGTTLSQDLTKDMATAAENAVGLQGAMDAFDKDVVNASTDTAKGQKDRQTLLNDLKILNITGPQANAVLKAMTGSVDINGREALATHKARQIFNNDVQGILNRVPTAGRDIDALSAAVRDHGTRSDAARGARQRLIDDLVASGKSSKEATRLVDNLQTAINNMHGKTVNVGVFASGGGGMTFTQKVASSISSGGFSLHSLAGGGLIKMGSGPVADDVPAMLSRGEVVVPTNLVNAGAVDHLRGVLPGFASGGVAGMVPWAANAEAGFAQAAEAAFLRAEQANLKKSVSSAAKAAAAKAGVSNPTGAVSGGVEHWRPLVAKVLSYEHLNPGFILDVLYQMMTESGGNPNAINLNDSNAAAGDPSRGLMQTIMSTFLRWHWPGTSFNIYDPEANIAAALNYGAHNGRGFGTGPGQIGSGHGYAAGGMVGMASGGSVSQQGSAYLNAWRTRHGGGFGAAWGPVVVNQQIAAMQAAQHKASVLSHATGLNATQHRHYAAVAADEAKRLNVLKHELTTERSWRSQLGSSDTSLKSYISAAGANPSLAKNVRSWRAQIGRQQGTIAAISKMLGYSNAHIAADVAAGRLGPGGTPLPKITHTFGGDVGNTIGAYLASVMSPLGMAGGGQVKSYDKGGWLAPGLTMAYNGTGRNERVGGSDVTVTLQVDAGSSGADQFLAAMIKKYVKVNGSGNVQKAYGAH